MDLVGDMMKIPKLYSFVYLGIPLFVIVSSSTVTANCDYVLCKLSKQQSDDTGYFASGSAISSQYMLPDGSVLTNSKESTLSSDGIKRTFHELKKEADRFVHSSSNQESFNTIPKIPGIISVPDIPVAHIPHGSITNRPFQYSLSNSGHQSGYSQFQFQASNSAAPVQQQYQVTAPKVTSFTNEHEIKKKVVATSKGTLQYPGAVVNQYVNTNANSDTSLPLKFPGGSSNLKYQDVSSSYNTASGGNLVPVVSDDVPVISSQSSSYQSSSSSSQSTSGGNQFQEAPVYGNTQPSSFHTGVLSLNPVYSSSLPKGQMNNVGIREEEHYKEDLHSEIPNAVPGYNVVGSPITIKYQQVDHYGKSKDQEGSVIKPASVAKVIQYSVENSSHLHSESHSGLPTAHVSRMNVNVKPAAVVSSGYQHESASSQVASGHHMTGKEYSSPGVAYVPAANADSNQSQDKQHYSSSQTFGFQSPVLLHGVPQNIPLDRQEASYSNTGSNYFGSGYSNRAADGVAVPVVVHGMPSISSSSKSSSSNYYSSSNNGAVVPSNSGYYYSEADAGLINTNGASASIYDSAAVNSNAGSLCGECFNKASLLGSSTGVGLPIGKSSYGISTSFSSHSSSVNGKKTSESREAAVTVNDNGKVDSYHVKS